MKICILSLVLLVSFLATAQIFYLFIRTYAYRGSKGIYVYRFNAATGAAEWVSNTHSIINPSYLAIAPNEKQYMQLMKPKGMMEVM